MKLIRKTTILGFVVAFVGFIVAVFSEDRTIGRTIFLIGFFVLCGGIVTLMISTRTDTFPRGIGPGIKIAAAGFGVIALGYLIDLLLGLDNVVGKPFFWFGFAIMGIGILMGLVKITRS